MIKFRAKQARSTLNQMEWYMSKRSKNCKTLNTSGLRDLENSIAPWPRWGMRVPKMDAAASMINRTMVSLTELKKRHKKWGLFEVSEGVITDARVFAFQN